MGQVSIFASRFWGMSTDRGECGFPNAAAKAVEKAVDSGWTHDTERRVMVTPDGSRSDECGCPVCSPQSYGLTI